jgi:hypothetical protein
LAKATPAQPVSLNGPTTFRKALGRIIAIGDLHGDLQAAIASFKLASLIDDTEKWVGGNTVVVQTGDLLDRGDFERPLLEWFDKMEERAKAAGGAVYRLNGNHEIMNVAEDLRYVSAAGFSAFNDNSGDRLPPEYSGAPDRAHGRLLAFLPGRPWAKKLSQQPVVLVVNDTVFAHGGVRPSHVAYDISRMNAEVSAWMRGGAELPRALQSDDTPYWIRDYGEEVTDAACSALDSALKSLKALRLVVGHTPQKTGITFACDGKVARIDVGLSSFYGNRAPTVLEIQGSKVAVLDAQTKNPKN